MPISPTSFDRWKPLSSAGRAMMREMAADVAELFSHLPAIRKKILEPGQPNYSIPSTTTASTTRRRLLITDATSIGSNQWEYTVSVDGDDGEAQNLYEQSPWGHGQELELDLGNLVPGPVEGTVWCDQLDDGTWEFDVVCPLVPVCAEP